MTNDEIVAPIQSVTKQCSKCDAVKFLDDFYANGRGGKRPDCKVCSKETNTKGVGFVLDPVQHGSKDCCVCKKHKDYSGFSKDKWQPDGYDRECRDCKSKRAKAYQQKLNPHRRVKQKDTQNFAPVREKVFKKKKTIAEVKSIYNEVYELQQGVCAICGKSESVRNQHRVKRLAVDHCHATEQFRGLLCTNCNMGLGYFKDNPETLQSAILYLQRDNSVINARLHL